MDTNNSDTSNSKANLLSVETQSNGMIGNDRVHIDAPAAGSVQVIDVQNAREIAFNFDLSSVRVSAIDVDLVLLFPDNSKLILPGLAMDLLGASAPKLRALNKLIQSQDLIASISQVNLSETAPSVHLASSDFLPKKQGGNSPDDKSSADGSQNAEVTPVAAAAPIITPVRPSVVIEPVKSSAANGAKVEVVEAGSIASSKLSTASSSGEPPAPRNPPPTSSSQANSAAKGNAPFSIQAADVTIKALAISGSQETEQSSGKIIVGGGGTAAAADDASFAAQSAKESLSGGSGNDCLVGGSMNDTLDGGGNIDTLSGGGGNDCLIGTGGADIMRGGENNDYMLIDQSFLGGGGSIDGGSGMDTISFAANSGDITLTNVNFDNIVTNVEVLDFTSVGTNVTMSLNATDIASLTGKGLGTSNTLDIFQNAGDEISIATQAGYTFDTTTSNGITTYTFYNSTDPHDPANQLAQINVH